LFVAKAVSKDITRDNLSVIHVEEIDNGSRLVATDGVRLHIAEIATKIKAGNYKPLISKDAIGFTEADTDITFPNWPRVIPERPMMRGTISLENTGFGKNVTQTEQMAAAFTALIKQTGESVNLRFLDDLPKTEWQVFSQNQTGRALILKENAHADSVYAVMMPLPAATIDAMAKAA
jgi:DNA polymerase III sliding clamp (beta) subunit (PCNA family)